MSINVFGYDDEVEVFPLHIRKSDFQPAVDLILLSQGDKRHFLFDKTF